MKNLLIVTEQCWPDGGGGLLATHLIAKILVQHGFKVTVVTGTDQPSRIDGVNYVIVASLKPRNKFTLWLNLASLIRTSWFRKLLKEADLVYIPRYCYPVSPYAKRFEKKVIVHLHAYEPVSCNAAILHSDLNNQISNPLKSVSENVRYELMEHRSPFRAISSTLLTPTNGLIRHWLSEADEIICVSKKQAEIISGKVNVEVKVIYNLLPETESVTKKIDGASFLYTGGTGYLKGMHILVDASKRILRKNRNTRFVVTKGLQTLWQEALTENLVEAYHVLGWVKYEELKRLHSSTLALIFPSIWEEPLPYTVSEAMLNGTIPIASRVGGVPEIVRGSFAEKMLFQPGNAEELVEKMESILTMNTEEISDVGLSLRESVLKTFNQENTEKRLLELFHS